VEALAASHAPKGAAAAAAADPKQGALKAVLSPCLAMPAEPEEVPDTAAASEQVAPEIQ
jgi:hypothetical protein